MSDLAPAVTAPFPTRSPLVHKALLFARKRLATQWRTSSGEEAISHSLRVARRLRDSFGSCEGVVTAIALLHDVLEDTPTSIDELRREFGPRVADGVLLLTKPKLGAKREARCLYQNALADATDEVRLVKLADYLDNITMRKSKARRRAAAKGAMQFLKKLGRRRLSTRTRRAVRILMHEIERMHPGNC